MNSFVFHMFRPFWLSLGRMTTYMVKYTEVDALKLMIFYSYSLNMKLSNNYVFNVLPILTTI